MQSTEKFHSGQEGFPGRLRWAREKLGLSVQEFATAAGYNRTYIYRLEHGDASRPSAEFFEKLSETFGLRRDWLVTGDGAPFVSEEAERMVSDAAKRGSAKPLNFPIGREPSTIPILLSTFSIEELNQVVAFFLDDVKSRPIHIQKLAMEIAHAAFNEIRTRLKEQGAAGKLKNIISHRDKNPKTK